MPSTYAHYKLGHDVQNRLIGAQRVIVDSQNDLYTIGLHGPDILFYHRPLVSDPVNAVGYSLHEKSGRSFFERARDAVIVSENQAAALAYAYGVLCHFALDASCHAYVDEKINASGIPHTEIEVEFDRMLMLDDDLDPVTCNLAAHIVPSCINASIIAPFYPGVSARSVHSSLKSMKRCNKLLIARTPLKRHLIFTLMRLTGNYREMHGLIVNPQGNPLCDDSNKELKRLYNTAVKRAVSIMTDFDEFLAERADLPEFFNRAFSGRVPEKAEVDE